MKTKTNDSTLKQVLFSLLEGRERGHFVAIAVVTVAALLVTVFGWRGARAAETDLIAATVTANNLSVSVSDGTIAFGSVSLNTATTTAGGPETQTVTNDGSDAQLNVRTSDATGGTQWTVATSPGSDEFQMEVSTTTGSTYATFQATDTYLTASSTFDSLTNGSLDFRLTTPTDSTDFQQKSISITVQVTTQE